jgi:hypothetical protein
MYKVEIVRAGISPIQVKFEFGFGPMIFDTGKCKKLSTAQAGASGREGMLHFFIIPHVHTQSNLVSNFHVILFCLCFRGITLSPDNILHNSTCQVLCGSCKKLPRIPLHCCYIFFWSFGIIDSSTFIIKK